MACVVACPDEPIRPSGQAIRPTRQTSQLRSIMSEYNLAAGELVVMQETFVRLKCGDEDKTLDELVLTNQNLILVDSVSRGFFKRERYLKRCPLEHILRTESGEPQIVVSNYRSRYLLQIAFQEETIAFLFSSDEKREAKRWSKNIRNVTLGYLTELQDESDLPPEISDAIDGVKNFVGAITGKKSQELPPPPPGAAPVSLTSPHGARANSANERFSSTGSQKDAAAMGALAGKCPGCHAPLAGKPGTTATCSYCDTTYTL